MTPEMKERVLATVNELIDCCEGPEPCNCDFACEPYDGPYEPRCWGFNSYEHYKGECQHFALDEAATDDDGPDADYEFERRWDDGEGR